LALDRPELRDKVAHGVGIVQDVTTPSNAPYAVTGFGVTPFDPNAANALLDRGGWKRGTDGVREKDGVKLVLVFATVRGWQDVDEQIELIRANWKKIGVDLDVRHYAAAKLFAPPQMGGIVYGSAWDVTAFAWNNDAIGDLSPYYGCHAFPPNGQNNLKWCDPRAGAAMEAFYAQFDQPQRNASVRIVERALVDDAPTIVTTLREDLFLYNRDLRNFHPNTISPFDNMMDVDI
jgi:peptide/nickel transport system substrate-binding protein